LIDILTLLEVGLRLLLSLFLLFKGSNLMIELLDLLLASIFVLVLKAAQQHAHRCQARLLAWSLRSLTAVVIAAGISSVGSRVKHALG